MADEFKGLEFERPVFELEKKIADLRKAAGEPHPHDDVSLIDLDKEIINLEHKCAALRQDIYSNLKPPQRFQLARHPKRPYSLDYIAHIFTDFTELHGDRSFADDKALVTGFGMLDNTTFMIIAQQKGRTLQESMERNFGMMHPEGYRKALRMMKMAEKFHKPIITFIDTMGAFPGLGAEERGQAEAIARNLREMSALEVPVICVVLGEGGSGGALGIGVGDKILMLENAYYSVITPEGCASILFHDAGKAAEAAEAMKITANNLYEFKVIDEIIPEPLGGAHRDVKETANNIKTAILKHYAGLSKMSGPQIQKARYNKYRILGNFEE
ncbi:MAG: acetyl-CoA carboxylase carboxyltransferase subunit alpha [Elusimicrobia bacterium RIFOXYA2_FULL_39_19]|nr:MAG: acetyl-CoA carboxylase carboxyltransferase subunit alpha [Elusimicrobia bacterium RIFOXYA2_FULL_39_19]